MGEDGKEERQGTVMGRQKPNRGDRMEGQRVFQK